MKPAEMRWRKTGPMDGLLLTAVLLLCLFGVLMVYSSSAILAKVAHQSDTVFLRSHVGKLGLGLVLLFLFARLPHRLLTGRVAYGVWGGALVLLLLLLLPFGLAVVVRDTRRFLNLGFFALQPAEFARLATIVLLASYAGRRREWIRESWRSLIVPLGILGLTCSLILLQPNLSSAALLGILGFALLWLSGQPLRRLAAVLLPLGGIVAVSLKDYQIRRVQEFLQTLGHGGETALTYHLKQSLIAMGSGGFLGQGIGQGLQKYHYLPFPHTDSILGVVGEETGFLGVLVLFTVYGLVILRGLRIARHAPDSFGGLLALGITLSLAVNFLLHSAVVLGLGPATGVPLPFISHGGSSLLANLIGMGILLSISRHARPESATIREPWRLPGGLLRTS